MIQARVEPVQNATTGSSGLGTQSFWRSIWATRLTVGIVLLVCALYMARELKRGWVPMDEGFLGKCAELTLQGQLPHRDFHDGYTGGLSFLNALTFRLFGVNSVSMRYALYLFFLLWLPAMYYVFSRFVSPLVASLLTLLSVAWGPPNYTANMPSWYNLFFATFALAALLRHIERPKWYWLLLAGASAGCSFAFKQTGLYLIGAILLFFLFRERTRQTKPSQPVHRSGAYRAVLCAAVLVFEAALFLLLAKKPGVISFGYFFIPGALLGLAILWLELTAGESDERPFRFVLCETTPFVVGVAVPILALLMPYIRAGAVPAFVNDVFVLAGKQVAHTMVSPTATKFFAGLVIDLILMAVFFLAPTRVRKAALIAVLVGMPCSLLMALKVPLVYKAIWGTFWLTLPVTVVAGLFIILRPRRSEPESTDWRQKVFLALSVAALCGLVQFPFVVGIYFCYVGPLVVAAVTAVLTSIHQPPRTFLVATYCFALFYAVFEVTPGWVNGTMGQYRDPDIQTVYARVPRVEGLRTYPQQAFVYEKLTRIIRQHAHGEYLFATPDCPEMYYFYGFRNPTTSFFDFIDEPTGRTGRLLNALHGHQVNLVVLNSTPLFSDPVSDDLCFAIEREFPNLERAGRFEVRWK